MLAYTWEANEVWKQRNEALHILGNTAAWHLHVYEVP